MDASRLGRATAAIAAGTSHTCALFEGGSLKCWGGDFRGELGLGDNESRGDNPGEMGDNLPAVDVGPRSRADARSELVGHIP